MVARRMYMSIGGERLLAHLLEIPGLKQPGRFTVIVSRALEVLGGLQVMMS
jgi:hypothetical protein